jgi:hypothetical protein
MATDRERRYKIPLCVGKDLFHEMLSDLLSGVEYVVERTGYGEVTLRVVVRPDGIPRWYVAPEVNRKVSKGE